MAFRKTAKAHWLKRTEFLASWRAVSDLSLVGHVERLNRRLLRKPFFLRNADKTLAVLPEIANPSATCGAK